MGTPDVPTIINIRSTEDYARDTALIPSARCVSHQTILNTPQETPQEKSGNPTVGKTVIGCQHGHKVSHGAAAFLLTPGVAAEVLSGGL